jgi:hypothetical protein
VSRRGQAGVELLALVPVLVAAVLLAWQLIALLAAAGRAQDRARADALAATGPAGRALTVRAQVTLPGLLPGLGPRLVVPARAVVVP